MYSIFVTGFVCVGKFGLYRRRRDKPRDYARCKILREQGQALMKSKFDSIHPLQLNENDRKVLDLLATLGLNAYSHPFHKVPMGYLNNLYKTPYDLLHTLCGGIIKAIVFVVAHIIATLRFEYDKEFDHASHLFDSRLRSFPSMGKDILPHVEQTTFRQGFMRYVAGMSSSEKQSSTGSAGGHIRSKQFVTLLLQMYFAIGDKGDVLPSTKEFRYYQRKKPNDIDEQLGNITEKVLSCIETALSFYFLCKKAEHNDSSIQELFKVALRLQAQFALIWEIKQAMVGGQPDPIG
jgi:hypothetical protein